MCLFFIVRGIILSVIGMCCGGKRSGSDDASLLINDEEGVMERSVDSHFSQSGHEVAIKVPESVSIEPY